MADKLIFRFNFQTRYRAPLAAIGVSPATAYVVLEDDLLARFGPWTARTPFVNITKVCLSGPYKAYRAIGARASFADGGATFGTTTAGGVCLEFAEPIRALMPSDKVRHPGLTLTIKDREDFAEQVCKRAGLTGPVRI